MSLANLTRRGTTLVVMAGYLLAATVSGMFHNHGGGSCGGEQCGTRNAKCGVASGCGAHRGHAHHHGGAHSHGESCEHAAGHRHESDEATNCAEKPAGRSGNPGPCGHEPLHHDDCDACRFLAQHSVVAPRFELELTETVAPLTSEAAPVFVPAIVADAHPARGPPQAA